jgi:hypothetical protein
MQKVLYPILLLFLLLLSGCRQVEYVTVDRVHTDTLYQKVDVRDSVFLRDSIYLHEWMKGDTVFVEKTRWKESVKELLRVDTVYKVRVDSIPVPYPVAKPHDAVSAFDKLRMGIGSVVLILFVGLLVFKVLKWRKVL